jgi:hypothetical protein
MLDRLRGEGECGISVGWAGYRIGSPGWVFRQRISFRRPLYSFPYNICMGFRKTNCGISSRKRWRRKAAPDVSDLESPTSRATHKSSQSTPSLLQDVTVLLRAQTRSAMLAALPSEKTFGRTRMERIAESTCERGSSPSAVGVCFPREKGQLYSVKMAEPGPARCWLTVRRLEKTWNEPGQRGLATP